MNSINEDFLDNNFLKKFLEKIKNYDDNINMIFYGIPGSGKTTLTRNYLKQIYSDSKNYLEINSSDYRGISYYKDVLLDFINNKNIHKKTIFLDEVDNLTQNSQYYINNIIEYINLNNLNVNFIIVCNYINNLNLNIINKFFTFRFKKISNSILKSQFDKLCISKNLNIKNKTKIIKSFNNDFRKLQQFFNLESYIVDIDYNNLFKKIISILYDNDLSIVNKYNSINNLIININLRDILDEFFKYCIDKLDIDNSILIDIFIKLKNNIQIDYNKKIKIYEIIFSFNNI